MSLVGREEAMTFPETRLTLIQRLAVGGSSDDWRVFLKDYWGPVCRFAMRSGAGQISDAEDVAAQAFEVVLINGLLGRWIANRTARLRTVLCSVTRKILANRHRIRAGRERLDREAAELWAQPEAVEDEQSKLFYAAWVEELVRLAVDTVAAAYYRDGKGNYVRVLYSRICEGAGVAELAVDLDISSSSASNYFQHARQFLAETLEKLVRRHVQRYCGSDDCDGDFRDEWQRLHDFLAAHGGLEEAIRRAYDIMDPDAVQANKKAAQRAAQRAAVSQLASAASR
jgi:DNA-directed RNA polymerase specialized sigma24 family protein